ncbi:hypothetical protein TNCV_4111441 [Trichonephila clavipes]|nr:hypothetical protein TNCV_4111441 [Trichonephila clavipes]
MGIDDDSPNIWKDNCFSKYEKRSEELNDVSFAQFVAYYNVRDDVSYTKRKNENAEILSEMEFVNMYNNDEDLILQRRKEFESDLNILRKLSKYALVCVVKMSDDSNQQEANKTTTE